MEKRDQKEWRFLKENAGKDEHYSALEAARNQKNPTRQKYKITEEYIKELRRLMED